MVKVALVGDVHGNLPALEAVLADADARGCEAIWNAGDFVGYGAFPDQVVKLLREREAVSILGNYDAKALRAKKKRGKWRKKGKRDEKVMAFLWAYEHLSKKSRKYLKALPEQRRLDAEGLRVLLCHGSPEAVDEHLGPDTPDARFIELAALADADIVVSGHSHEPFVRKAADATFINTGSVGRPDDGDPRACYAILELAPPRTRTRHRRLEYDVARAVAALREHGLPEAFAQMVLQGRGLDAVAPP